MVEARADYFVQTYSNSVQALRQVLSRTGFGLAHVVDVAWRVDYQVKADSLDRLNAPTFFVTLKVAKHDAPSLEEVGLTLSQSEMQDFVAKLKDASGALNRLDLYS